VGPLTSQRRRYRFCEPSRAGFRAPLLDDPFEDPAPTAGKPRNSPRHRFRRERRVQVRRHRQPIHLDQPIPRAVRLGAFDCGETGRRQQSGGLQPSHRSAGLLLTVALTVAAGLVAVRRGYPAERFPGWGCCCGCWWRRHPGCCWSSASSPTSAAAFHRDGKRLRAVMYALLVTTLLLVNLGDWLITPPVGPVPFVACAVDRMTMWQAARTSLPFYSAAASCRC